MHKEATKEERKILRNVILARLENSYAILHHVKGSNPVEAYISLGHSNGDIKSIPIKDAYLLRAVLNQAIEVHENSSVAVVNGLLGEDT